jgi:threonine/homoserine/homoserine lactone efflux protein
MTLAAFLTACALHLMAAISPGPAVLMAARTGMVEGMRTGVFLAFGIAFGAVFWASAALFGLSVLFEVAPSLLWALKLAGGIYLLWMAWHMWQHAAEPMTTDSPDAPPRSAVSALWLGIRTQLANPKPAVCRAALRPGSSEHSSAWFFWTKRSGISLSRDCFRCRGSNRVIWR